MFGKILNFLDRVLTFFEEWTLFISVMVSLVALFFNVILRYGFNYSLAWSEELVREVIIYTTFIGCSAAVKNRSLIRIDASVQIFPKLKVPLTFFSNFVVMIFAIMMTRNIAKPETGPRYNANWVWALVIALFIFVALAWLLSTWPAISAEPEILVSDPLVNLGISLVSPDGYILAFELASVLLLAALIGAIVIAWERK